MLRKLSARACDEALGPKWLSLKLIPSELAPTIPKFRPQFHLHEILTIANFNLDNRQNGAHQSRREGQDVRGILLYLSLIQ